MCPNKMLHAIQTLGGKVAFDGKREVVKVDLGTRAVSNRILTDLKGFAFLRELYLGYTLVDDTGLADLGALPKLRLLDLENTAITDSGLKHLLGLSALRLLNLNSTS